MRMIDGLAFLPSHLVTEGWETLMARNPYVGDPDVTRFLDYKEKYYVGERQVMVAPTGAQIRLTTRDDAVLVTLLITGGIRELI